MVELAAANAPIEAVYVANAEAEEDAETLRKAMLELFPGLPVLVTGIGTVLAAHLGRCYWPFCAAAALKKGADLI